jgi:hypothetical protein
MFSTSAPPSRHLELKLRQRGRQVQPSWQAHFHRLLARQCTIKDEQLDYFGHRDREIEVASMAIGISCAVPRPQEPMRCEELRRFRPQSGSIEHPGVGRKIAGT